MNLLNLYLKNQYLQSNGIFGTLENDDKTLFFAQAQHAYPVNSDVASVSTVYKPKVPPGTYQALRYMSPKHGYEVFCLQDVPGCQYIEIHPGSFPQVDSIGCILIGESRVGDMISMSQAAFKRFMSIMTGIDSFTLTVS